MADTISYQYRYQIRECVYVYKCVCVCVCACVCSPTLAVTVVSHLDLEARQTGVPVELTVVPIRLSITATH